MDMRERSKHGRISSEMAKEELEERKRSLKAKIDLVRNTNGVLRTP